MSGFNFIRTALLFAFLAPLPGRTQPAELPDCSAKMSPGLRQQCEEEFSRRVGASSQTTMLPGGWRLVKTPDPRGGPQVASVVHISDTSKSDVGLAGLTLRCGRIGIETLLVMLDPLPSGSRPKITVTDRQNEKPFEAAAVDGGQMLLLPQEASDLAKGSWQTATELSVKIAAQPNPIRGVIPVAGLPGALQTLSQTCTAR